MTKKYDQQLKFFNQLKVGDTVYPLFSKHHPPAIKALKDFTYVRIKLFEVSESKVTETETKTVVPGTNLFDSTGGIKNNRVVAKSKTNRSLGEGFTDPERVYSTLKAAQIAAERNNKKEIEEIFKEAIRGENIDISIERDKIKDALTKIKEHESNKKTIEKLKKSLKKI